MKTSNIRRNIAAASIASVLMLTNACGLKGDLYIPEKEITPASPTADSGEEDESESESQDKQLSD
jgi:predicted small lipoprotein YifL